MDGVLQSFRSTKQQIQTVKPKVSQVNYLSLLKKTTVCMRMFSSLIERRNVLRAPKKTSDVSTGFRPPCLESCGEQRMGSENHSKHGFFILNTLIFSDNSSLEYRTSPKLWHVVYILLFYDLSVS